jgi:hypothetical protein
VNLFAGRLDASGRLAGGSVSPAPSLGVHVCAWLTGTVGVGQLNLDDAATRAAIVASASRLLRSGFTGLQLDLGPVSSGDAGLLTLLTALHGLHPGVLGVMTPKLEPLAGLTLPGSLLLGHPAFWTSAYLSRVAALASQVTVLAYSTGLPFPSWYSGYVARETRAALAAVKGAWGGTGRWAGGGSTSLLIGVPAFTESTTGHHGSAETVGAALAGIRAAVTGAGRHAGRGSFGVGLVVEPPGAAGSAGAGSAGAGSAGAPGSADWSAYQSGWVSPAS